MQHLKKTFKLVTTTGSTDNENEYIIIPDETVNYNFKFFLRSNVNNLGFFDVLDYTDGTESDEYVVSGETFSRLSEIRKYKQNGDLDEMYFVSSGMTENGLDLDRTTSGETYVYYIDEVEYIDDLEENVTYFYLYSNGLNSNNSIIGNIYKNDDLNGIISKPRVKSDIFLDRPQQKILNNVFNLRNINNISDLVNYIGGSYYNIIKNE
ncbi:MAG: hypothetical protein ACOC2W_04410 [bacterium]